jgi:hypothetical protein
MQSEISTHKSWKQLFIESFQKFSEKYLSVFGRKGHEIDRYYKDNFGEEQFKEFYFLGLDIIKYDIPFITNRQHESLRKTYQNSDYNIYSNVYYPNGINDQIMKEFRNIMYECVKYWEQWCSVYTYD